MTSKGPYDSSKGDLLAKIFNYIVENPGITIYELLEELFLEYEIGYMLIGLLDGQGRLLIQDDLYEYESWKNLKLYAVTTPGMDWCAIGHHEKPYDEIFDLDESKVCTHCLPQYEEWKKTRYMQRARDIGPGQLIAPKVVS